jgi:Protein required for attachment to host cells
VTDLSGRFPRGSGAVEATGAMSDGERHNIELEWRKRLIRRMAARLGALFRKPEVERCYLAASREINRPLLDELDGTVRAKIEKNIIADLTKTEKSDLLRHFGPPGPQASEQRPFA